MTSRKRPNPGQVSGRGAGEQLRSPLFQGCHLGPQAVQFAIYLRKRRLRLSFLQVVVPTCCLDECLNLRSEKAQPGIAVDGTLSVLQLAVADRLDDLVLSESELGASSLVAQGGALASPLGFEAVDDSPLPRNGLGNGAAGDDMVSDAHAVRVLNRGYRPACGRAWAVCEQQGGSGDVPDSELARRYRRIPSQITPSPGTRGGDRRLGLRLDQCLLDRAEQVLGLGQVQAERVRGQDAALQAEHLADHGRARLVVVLEHDLHGDFHAALPRRGRQARPVAG